MTQTMGSWQETRTGLLIDGEIEGADEWFPVFDPAAPHQVVGYAAVATPEQARRAVDAADTAWTRWSAQEPEQRAELLLEALRDLHDSAEARSDLLVRESGLTRTEAQLELSVFEQRCITAAGIAGELRQVRRLLPQPRQGEAPFNAPLREGLAPDQVRSEISVMPLGAVTIILPPTWALAVLATSLPHALVAGNTVIVAPSPTAPLTVVRTLQLLAERLPAGVLNVVTGSDEAVSPTIRDPRVRRIVFTGSPEAGRTILRVAADTITRVTLQLGGNNPAILLDDVALDAVTVERIAVGAFMIAGQLHRGVKRLYVHRSRYQELVEALSAQLANHRIGHGLHPDTTMGPLINARDRDHARDLSDRARAIGCEVREFGEIGEETQQSGGYFLRPALVLDPPLDESIVVEAQSGPVLPILPYDDVDRVVAAVNQDWAGLCSSVWSTDLDRAGEVAARLRTGTTWINGAGVLAEDDRAPSGGFRQSGIGLQKGIEGLMEMSETHTVTYPG